jgi:hypothetical protein
VKLVLPESVEPTTTEVFFDEVIAAQVEAKKASTKKKPKSAGDDA